MKTTRMPEKNPQLLVETFSDGIVVYQQATKNLHRLEAEAAQAFLRCDGSSAQAEVAEELFPGDGSAMERLEHILHDLEELKLIRSEEIEGTGVSSPARRAFLQKAAAAATLAAPLIYTFVMPTPAQAQSASGQGGPGIPGVPGGPIGFPA